MSVQLITCTESPQCVSTKMFLDLQGIEYTEKVVSHDEMKHIELDSHEMPILVVDGEVEMSGFDATVLKELFNK